MSSTVKTLIDKNSSVLSTSEWYKQQTSKPPNTCYYVKSDTTIDTIYTITYANETNCYSCNCPAWSLCFYHINQSDNQRTCKHLIVEFENLELVGKVCESKPSSLVTFVWRKGSTLLEPCQ